MNFIPTKYKLVNVADGRLFEDEGWTLNDPQGTTPSLVRADYENKQFSPRNYLNGIYRYADWMPIQRVLEGSCAPVTYVSRGLAAFLGLEHLYITFSGWHPEIGAKMRTCSFKETEAYSVLARLAPDEKRVLVVQSAGNTARAFAQVCSDNNIQVVICIPEDNLKELWFRQPLNECVKVVATPKGCDYFDAIALGEKLANDEHYMLEGGAKNIARRDGMGTTVLSCVEQMGRIPDAYFQAVGSGTGAIAAWENAQRLAYDGRFGENKMRVYVAQNKPFTLLYDSWEAGARSLVELSAEEGRKQAEIIQAKVLSNRKPPYGLVGGLFDTLKNSNGDMFLADNSDIAFWKMQYQKLEGYELLPAACVAVAALAQAVGNGTVKRSEYIMLNCTGGGETAAKADGFVFKSADIVLSPELPAQDIIDKVNQLFA